MSEYTPKVGDTVIVDYADLNYSAEKIARVTADATGILLFEGRSCEQWAERNPDGRWRLTQSGNHVVLLDPHARPEKGGLGFVIGCVGPVEKWLIGDTSAKNRATAILEGKRVAGSAHMLTDETWRINDRSQIFFVSAEQAQWLSGFNDSDKLPVVGDEFHTVGHDATQEVWLIVSINGDHFYASQIIDGQDYYRTFEHTGDKWMCVDDPDEFAVIDHRKVTIPEPVRTENTSGRPVATYQDPADGDLVARVIDESSLLYRVRRVLTRSTYKLALLATVGTYVGYETTATAYKLAGQPWQWENGEPITFTRGNTDEIAVKAVRLDTLHTALCSNYFHYEELAHRPADNGVRTQANAEAAAMRDECAKLMFHVETGLMPEQAPSRFESFYEALHDAYLASIEG